MTDTVSKETRSWVMSRIRSKNTKPEKVVRSLLHRLGYRFRLHNKKLPGKPDIALKKYRTVIFVHGCFWHQHQDPECKKARVPKSRTEWWEAKFRRNRERDAVALARLEKLGWRVIVVWECQLKDIDALTAKLTAAMPREAADYADSASAEIPAVAAEDAVEYQPGGK